MGTYRIAGKVGRKKIWQIVPELNIVEILGDNYNISVIINS